MIDPREDPLQRFAREGSLLPPGVWARARTALLLASVVRVVGLLVVCGVLLFVGIGVGMGLGRLAGGLGGLLPIVGSLLGILFPVLGSMAWLKVVASFRRWLAERALRHLEGERALASATAGGSPVAVRSEPTRR